MVRIDDLPAREANVLRKRRAHWNDTGKPDALSRAIHERLDSLGLTQAEFAAATTPVKASRGVRRTNAALVCRVLLGTRPIPVNRIESWARALKIVKRGDLVEFIDCALIANALRSARRCPGRSRAVASAADQLEEQLAERLRDATWSRGTGPAGGRR